jgi:hypothetical protein
MNWRERRDLPVILAIGAVVIIIIALVSYYG